MAVHGHHVVYQIAVGQEALRKAVARVQRRPHRIFVPEDHGRLVQEDHVQSGRTHGIDAVVTQRHRLGLVLGEVGHDVVRVELPLRNPDNPLHVRPLALGIGRAKRRERQRVRVLVHLQTGVDQCRLQLLQLRRQHPVLQAHRRRRVLHRPVVHHNNLLHVARNRRLGVARKRGSVCERCEQRRRGCHRQA